MAREVVIYTWCDVCFGRDDVRTDGAEFQVALGELGINKPLTVSLCEPHRKEVYDALRDLLQEYGQKGEDAAPPKKKGGGGKIGRPSVEDLTCPDCGHKAPNKTALGSHVRGRHQTTLAELTGAPTPYECPECNRGFDTPQGRGTHRRKAHGVTAAKKKKKDQPEDQTLV